MDITNDILFSLKKIQENNEVTISSLKVGLTFSQIHCIAAIGDIKDANVTKLSNELKMTTGAITKMCKKLFNQGFVTKYKNMGNNKEIYYKLTSLGENIYQTHNNIHNKSQNEKKFVINQYSEGEKITILRFLNDINSILDNTFKNLDKGEKAYE